MRTRKRVRNEKSSERNLLPGAVGGGRALTAREFQGLADVPPEAEWFANIDNRQTRRAYQNDIKDFMTFVEKPRLRAVVYFVIVNVLVVKVGGIAGGRKSFLTFESIGGRLRDETGCVALEQS